MGTMKIRAAVWETEQRTSCKIARRPFYARTKVEVSLIAPLFISHDRESVYSLLLALQPFPFCFSFECDSAIHTPESRGDIFHPDFPVCWNSLLDRRTRANTPAKVSWKIMIFFIWCDAPHEMLPMLIRTLSVFHKRSSTSSRCKFHWGKQQRILNDGNYSKNFSIDIWGKFLDSRESSTACEVSVVIYWDFLRNKRLEFSWMFLRRGWMYW